MTSESKDAMDKSIPISKVTDDSLKATIEIAVIYDETNAAFYITQNLKPPMYNY